MAGKRHIGLSSQQPVPRLLNSIRGHATPKETQDVPIDAPPLSSDDDDDGPSTRGDIRPSTFSSSSQRQHSPSRETSNVGSSRKSARETKPLGQARTWPQLDSRGKRGAGAKGRAGRWDSIKDDGFQGSPTSKKPRRSSRENEEPGSQFKPDIFAKKTVNRQQYGGRSQTFGDRARQREASTKRPNPRTKKSTPESKDAGKFKLNLPQSPSAPRESSVSPAKPKFKAIPDIDFDFQSTESQTRKMKRRFKAPPNDLARCNSPDESQRPVFRIPDEIPEPVITGLDDPFDLTCSPPTNTPDASTLLLRRSTSPLTDLESIDSTPRCPLCRKEVDAPLLNEFTTANPRPRIAAMRRFCEHHQRRTARDTWERRGYPDIDWTQLDARIAAHYPTLREILGGEAPSHYAEAFAEGVRAGRNRTTLQSDANLTPGYYGMRGLRAMTENLIVELAPLLRERAVADRLVSARGHTVYLQSVLVPELAARLVMEDMGVGEEEARGILAESSKIGELLNDEIPDVVVPGESDEDDDDDSVTMLD
ncbi:RTC4-like domain-containing protein [Staphylotrichum tortipilum]|uniref:Restriction of telomere capping protein 4 n=1 Tax=Staphylotrichum tortipilum TaxID=2831512 RepID=A0AAN6MNS9_9PEZI|nr:RTC4-like domain-containing protein [Staphylotrichum longicolle]